jgi:hypothetical protein
MNSGIGDRPRSNRPWSPDPFPSGRPARGEALEVGHLRRVLGRDDEAEVMSVLLTPLRERLGDERLGAR